MNESVQVVCPHCDAINRVPASRLPEDPRCGGCHKPLFGGGPVALSEERFTRHRQHSGIPLLVDFWAPWCGPCRSMAPDFEAAARALEPQLRLAKVNTEEAQHLATQYQIFGIPALLLFMHGQERARHAGALSAKGIVDWARQVVRESAPD